MDEDNRKRGEELNQLSRLLFDKAAKKWYEAILFEIIAGAVGALVGLLTLPDDSRLLAVIAGFILLCAAYVLRLQFAGIYDTAETMRRQSVLTEALGWPIGQVQFSEWRRKAGNSVLKTFRLKPRNADYYVTQQTNPPQRLLEMTAESAFWTRHLYGKLHDIVWVMFFIALATTFLVISVAPAQFIPAQMHTKIVYAVYLLLPLLLSIDLLGWALRLGRLIGAIKEIEDGLEKLANRDNLGEPEVMRLVSEYNCHVASGFPIHPRLFRLWYNEIGELWNNR